MDEIGWATMNQWVTLVSLFHSSKASWLFVAVTAVTVRSVVVKLCQRSWPPGGDGWLLLSPWGPKVSQISWICATDFRLTLVNLGALIYSLPHELQLQGWAWMLDFMLCH